MESASIAADVAHDEHHGPPAANQSSRVEAQFLGMLLFIISEIMLCLLYTSPSPRDS